MSWQRIATRELIGTGRFLAIEFNELDKFTGGVGKLARAEKIAGVAHKDFKVIGGLGVPKTPMEKVLSFVQKTKGVKTTFALSDRETIRMAAAGLDDQKLNKLVTAYLAHAKKPRVTIAYDNAGKGVSARIKLYDGKAQVGAGSISMSNPGQLDNVVEANLSFGRDGKAMSVNGFLDCSKKVDLMTDDIAVAVERKSGAYKSKASIDGIYSHHASINPNDSEFERVKSYLGLDKEVDMLMQKIQAFVADPTKAINRFMEMVATGKNV